MEESLESNSPKPSDSAQEFVDKPDTGMAIVDELIDKIKNGELVEKQRFVLNRLSTIRVSKGKILKHLQLMKQREDDGETINRELMQKLVDAYDGLMHQEREFITVMRSILANYKKAINFVTSEVGSLVRNETSESDSASGEARQQVKVSEKTVAELDTLIRGFNTMEGMMGEVEKASELDDQFKICVQMHIEQKKKMDLLHQIHMQEKLLTELTTKDFTDRAKTLVSNERSGLDRKQRQLERLRREAEKRGLLGGGSAQNRPPNSVSPVDSGPIIPENERIPAIPALPTPPQPSAESSNKEKDELRAKISERFASLEARKQRMRLLRKTLGSFERQKMENAYSDAVGRVQSLTEMRKKLEEVQTSLENAVSEDAHSTTRGTAQGQTDECSAKEELILQVRRAFNNTFKRMAAESKIGDSPFSDRLGNNSSFDSALSLLNDRMKTFESILHNHTDQLTWIGNQAAESCSSSATASVRVEPVLSTKEDVSKLMMDHIIKCLEGEFGSDRAQPLTEDIGRSIVRSINEKSAEMFPTEFDEKVSENFAVLFEGLMARFYGRAFEEVEQQMTDELRESIHSEFLFLQLMRSANEVLLGE